MKLRKKNVSLLGTIFDQLGKVLIVLNEQLVTKYINNYALEIINTNEDIIGFSLQDILLKSNIPFKLDEYERIIFPTPVKINNALKKLKTRAGTVDDKPVYFILDEDVTEQENTIYLLEKSTQDITGQVYTERLPTQQYLDETIGFLGKIIKQMPCYVYWKDKEFRYIYCNDLTVQIMGLSSVEEVKGKTDYDFGWERSVVDAFRETDIKILTTGEPVRNLTEDLIDKSGRIYHTLVNKLPIKNEAGVIIGILGITVDITEIQDMQIALQKAKEAAEVASIAKTEFIANMSHDIRTPLTGVIGLSKIMEDKSNDPDEKQYAHWINESGKQLLSLLNGILDIISAEHVNDNDLVYETFDLYRCIQDIEELELPTIKLKKLDLILDIPENIPQYLISDHTKLHRILLNLVGNAIKFTDKGHITISINLEERFEDSVRLRFKVIDTGIGIPIELQPKVFDRFFRVEPSYKGIYKGHGLGLHIAQSYVELLGGEITLSSEVNRGTEFHFDLVMKIGNPKTIINEEKNNHCVVDEKNSTSSLTADKCTAKYANAQTPYLLLVEDSPIALKMVQIAASNANCCYESAEDAFAALELIKNKSFDLIVTDIGLPGMSGIELTSTIRKWEQENQRQHTPIIGLTAHTGQAEAKKCLQAGMNKVLIKPATFKLIQISVEEFIESKGTDEPLFDPNP